MPSSSPQVALKFYWKERVCCNCTGYPTVVLKGP